MHNAPEKAPLNNEAIDSRLIGVGGGFRSGYSWWANAVGSFLNWINSIGEGTVTSDYKLDPPKAP